MIHVLDPVEAGQLRGMSRFAAAIVKLFTLDLYDDAELEHKKIAAMFAMFITCPAPETPLDPTDKDLEVEPGQVVRLDPGEDISTPATPNSGGTYRAVALPDALTNRGGTGHSLRLSDGRHRQGQFFEHADITDRIPSSDIG